MQHKAFDCVELMRKIRKQLVDEELQHMSTREKVKYFRSKCPEPRRTPRRSGLLGFLRGD